MDRISLGMKEFLVKKTRESKNFATFVAWMSLFASFTIAGAVVPLLPIFVQDLSEDKSQATKLPNFRNARNATISKSYNTTLNIENEATSQIVGALLGAGSLAQMISSPFVGFAIHKIGYDIPLFIGFAIQIGVSLGYAFANAQAMLFITKIAQGVGNALMRTSVFTMVTEIYEDDDTARGTALAYIACGLSAGFLIGPPFGSIMYQFGNKMAPFLCIAILLICIALLQLCIRVPRLRTSDPSNVENVSPWKTQLLLITDPYIVSCLLLQSLSLFGIAFLEATLSLHMLRTISAEKWMLGVAFLPMEIGFAIGTPFQSWMSRKLGRWVVALYSFILGAGPYIAYSFCRSFAELLIPGFPLGVFTSARNTAVSPILASLVHARYGPWAYGSGYALATLARAASLGTGPFLAGFLKPAIGFDGVMYLAATLSMTGIVPLAFLRKPLLKIKSNERKTSLASEEEEMEELKPEPSD